ncbi:hypothetical protein [Psychrilyobacter atlanticus]|uniref:hypothetical protein n=1 Tax=Psychrilyobacter atlanticus TaxID=271091 RepID=UPI0003FA0AD4|nr:hypothetical protein [Psychrilyobacter atlanticus]
MVVTELSLKESYKKQEFNKYYLEKGAILTPSAKQFLHDKKIEITKIKNEQEQNKKTTTENSIEKSVVAKYKGVMGEVYFEKPEYMTQLSENILIKKNHKIIFFRSKIDNFLSELILIEKQVNTDKNKGLKEDFKSIKQFLDEIIKAEVLNTKLDKDLKIFNLSLEKIRKISHNPKKYFSMDHLFGISSENNLRTLYLNKLRTLIREVEVTAVDAFVSESKVQKIDLLKALNRLSSAIYIMMLKEEKGEYGN